MISRYSSIRRQARDEEYLAAVAREDVGKLKELVAREAKAKGYKIGPVFHGTDEEFTVFEVQRTSYGFFTSFDRDSAAYYGDIVMPLFLKGTREADLEDGRDYLEIAETAIWSEDKRDEEDAVNWFVDLWESNFDSPVFQDVREEFQIPTYAEFLEKDCTLRDILVEEWSYSAVDEIEGWVEKHPEYQASFEKAAPKRNKEIEEVYELLGTQDFYLNYQNDFLQAAERIGFDIVHLLDPSSTGEPTSTVFFYPAQAKSAEPITYSDEEEIIPLSKRFDSSNPDIRY